MTEPGVAALILGSVGAALSVFTVIFTAFSSRRHLRVRRVEQRFALETHNRAFGLRTDRKSIDVFLAFDSEDAADLGKSLASALQARHLSVFLNSEKSFVTEQAQDRGGGPLSSSRLRLVVFSPKLFESSWGTRELRELFRSDIQGEQTILAVWHGMTDDQVRVLAPWFPSRVLADSATKSVEDMAQSVADIAAISEADD